jgi:peptidoglycan/LPS O-acetylase OafA/YrhL
MDKRTPELDSLRGLATMGIVLWHYSGHFGAQPLSGLFSNSRFVVAISKSRVSNHEKRPARL